MSNFENSLVLDNQSFKDKIHSFLSEVLPFLNRNHKLELREKALEALLSQDDLLVGICDEDLLTMVKAIKLCFDKESLIQLALPLLINISAESLIIFTKIDMTDLVEACFKASKNAEYENYAIIFIANISSLPEIASIILETRYEGTRLANFIIEKFINYNPQIEPLESQVEHLDWDAFDPLKHSGSILCNITQLEKGREIVCHRSSEYIPRICSQVIYFNNTFNSIALYPFVYYYYYYYYYYHYYDHYSLFSSLLFIFLIYFKTKIKNNNVIYYKKLRCDQRILCDEDPQLELLKTVCSIMKSTGGWLLKRKFFYIYFCLLWLTLPFRSRIW